MRLTIGCGEDINTLGQDRKRAVSVSGRAELVDPQRSWLLSGQPRHGKFYTRAVLPPAIPGSRSGAGLRDPSRPADVLALPDPIYDRFSEGFETADLKIGKNAS